MTEQNQPQDRTTELQEATTVFLDNLTSEAEALLVTEMIRERFNLMGAAYGEADFLGMLQDRIPSLGGEDAALALAPELASVVGALSGPRWAVTNAMSEQALDEMATQLDEFINPLVDTDCAPDLVLVTDTGATLTLNYFDDMEELTRFAKVVTGKTVAEVTRFAAASNVNCAPSSEVAGEAVVTVANVALRLSDDEGNREEFLLKVA